MPTTSNFGWTTPADTDLVKDGAAAIRTLGNGVDASFIDLKGGTTGQFLSKASNTDLDFTWTAGGDITEVQAGVGISVASGTGPIPVITNSSTDLITTAGDLLYGTAADTVARLGIGTAGQVLKVNSGATAPEWGSAGGLKSMTLLNAGGTALTGAATVTVSGISNQQALLVLFDAASSANASAIIALRINGITTNNYSWLGVQPENANNFQASATDSAFYIGAMSSNAASVVRGSCMIFGTSQSGFMPISVTGMGSAAGGTGQNGNVSHGYFNAAAPVTSISAFSYSGNFDAGTLYVYGMAA